MKQDSKGKFRRLSQEEFLSRCKKVHGQRYIYSQTIYQQQRGVISVGCRVHGAFETKAQTHLSGSHCPQCAKTYNVRKRERTLREGKLVPEQPEEFKYIVASKDTLVKVSNEDYEYLNKFLWHLSGKYISHNKLGMMHKLILQASKKEEVDHKNRDSLDNRRENLRIATRSENCINKAPIKGKFKGVKRVKSSGKWRGTLNHLKVRHHLGVFETEAEAAAAYDEKAKELFGEFAYLNFPIGGTK